MNEKAKNIFYNILVGILAVFVILQVLIPDVGMKVFRFRTFLIADTGSMEPELTYMDFIVVVRGDFNKIKVGSRELGVKGDYIVFYDQIDGELRPNTHEVVGRKILEDGTILYQTQGVAAGKPIDSRWVSLDGEKLVSGENTNEYIGKFAFKIPVLGKIISFLRSVPGMIFLSVNIVAIFIAIKLMKKPVKQGDVTEDHQHLQSL